MTGGGVQDRRRYEADAFRGEERGRYELDLEDLGDHRFRIVASGPTGVHRACADDLFEALLMVRREIEPAGWRLALNGARRDTWPSGMQRDMFEGGAVYVFFPDTAKRLEPVGTFDPAPKELLATVEEQEAAWEAWKARWHA